MQAPTVVSAMIAVLHAVVELARGFNGETDPSGSVVCGCFSLLESLERGEQVGNLTGEELIVGAEFLPGFPTLQRLFFCLAESREVDAKGDMAEEMDTVVVI